MYTYTKFNQIDSIPPRVFFPYLFLLTLLNAANRSFVLMQVESFTKADSTGWDGIDRAMRKCLQVLVSQPVDSNMFDSMKINKYLNEVRSNCDDVDDDD